MPVTLAEHTTLRIGGPASEFVIARTERELIDAVHSADQVGKPALVLGGGSNVVVGDAGFEGLVVHVATRGFQIEADDKAVRLTAEAGEPWDDLVHRAAFSQWVGIEALSGIPGLVGATPIQNVGAYGQEVAATVVGVRAWDRRSGEIVTFAADDCGFGYRTSRFKKEPGRFVILQVTFELERGALSAPIAYAELARSLGAEVGERRPLVDVREAVLGLRRSKGMVLDPADHDTWSAGSFFTNPIVAPEAVPEGAPSWPQSDGKVKTSAAWLIEKAGFPKGYGTGPAQLSHKHTLALTNRGGADASDVLALAREIRSGVAKQHGIELEPEPVLVSCRL